MPDVSLNESENIDSIFSASINGIYLCEAIRNEQKEIVDLLMKRVNPDFIRKRKRMQKEVVGNKYLFLFPRGKEARMFDIYCRIIKKKMKGDASLPLTPMAQNHSFYDIIISDNGIGFDQQYASCIFNAYQRFNTEKSGAGIGIFVTRTVVENHFGWIRATS